MADWNPNFIERSPLFAPFLELKDYFLTLPHWPLHEDLNDLIACNKEAILTQSKKTIRFVPQISGKLAFDQKYEARIFLTGEIQTRTNNWHDLFNALVWQIFPETKAVLNQIHFQVQQFELSNNIKDRSRLRDAVTLFDESGVIVVCDQMSLIQLLVNFEWKKLFWLQRDAVLQSMRFFIFGHGLYEKALQPYTGMTGKGIILNVEQTFFALTLADQLKRIDHILASHFTNVKLRSSHLTPVPILGYPNWTEENQNELYYDNKQYFRDRNQMMEGKELPGNNIGF